MFFSHLGKTIRGACLRQRPAATFRSLDRQRHRRIRHIRKSSTSGFVVRQTARALDANAHELEIDPWGWEYPSPSCRKSFRYRDRIFRAAMIVGVLVLPEVIVGVMMRR